MFSLQHQLVIILLKETLVIQQYQQDINVDGSSLPCNVFKC